MYVEMVYDYYQRINTERKELGKTYTNTKQREIVRPSRQSEKCALNLSLLITPPMYKRAVACITVLNPPAHSSTIGG